MIYRKRAYKYKTPFKGLYEIVQTWTNGLVRLQTGAVTTSVNPGITITVKQPLNRSYLD